METRTINIPGTEAIIEVLDPVFDDAVGAISYNVYITIHSDKGEGVFTLCFTDEEGQIACYNNLSEEHINRFVGAIEIAEQELQAAQAEAKARLN